MFSTMLSHRSTPPLATFRVAIALWVFVLPRTVLAFSTTRGPSGTAPTLIHIEGTVSREVPSGERFLSVGAEDETRYLAVRKLRALNTSTTSIALYDLLKTNWPNIHVGPASRRYAHELADPKLLGQSIILEGYVVNARGELFMTKLEPVRN